MKLYKTLLVLFTFSTLGFFQPFNVIPAQIIKAINYSLFFVVLIYPYLFHLDNSRLDLPLFKKPTLIMVLLMTFSVFMPFFSMQEQTPSVGFSVTIPFLCYALYFSLYKSGVDEHFIFRLVFGIAILGMITNIINRITFPLIVFGEPKEEYDFDRGGLRLVCIGFYYIILTFFIAIERWNSSRKLTWLLYMIISYSFIILSYTRQHILICSFLGVLMLFKAMPWHKKIVLAIMMVVFVAKVLPNVEMVEKMVEVTVEQQEKDEEKGVENIRIREALYFGIENYENIGQRFLGHGVPCYSRSTWGMEMFSIRLQNNMVQADVGWFGFMWYFGIIALFLLIRIVYLGIFKHDWDAGLFFFLWLAISSFASGALIHQHEIIIIVFAMYLVDTHISKQCFSK